MSDARLVPAWTQAPEAPPDPRVHLRRRALPRGVPAPLRRRGRVPDDLRLGLRDGLRARAAQAGVPRAARAAQGRRGERAARTGAGLPVGAAARRSRAPPPAEADAAAVPRPADARV